MQALNERSTRRASRDRSGAAEAPPAQARGHRPGALWALGAVGIAAAFVALVALFYVASVHSAAANSDGATVVLEGKAFAGGNLVLTHWTLSLDSFWLVDVPFYALGVLVLGVHPFLLHLVPAAIAALVVLVAARIAGTGYSSWAGVAAVATTATLLAFPVHALAQFFLMGPLHVATALLCLIAFACLRTGQLGWRWRWPVAVLALGAGMLGDFQASVLGVLPVFLAGLVAMARSRSWRAGAPAVSCGLAAGVLYEVVRRLGPAIGAFTLGPTNQRASLHQMSLNFGHAFAWFPPLAGVGNYPFGRFLEAPPWPLQAVHVVGLVALLVAALIAIARLVFGAVLGRQPTTRYNDKSRLSATWYDDVLVIAFVAGCALFVYLPQGSQPAYARYLTAPVIFAAILAGRLVGRSLAVRPKGARARRQRPTKIARSAAAAGIAVVMAYAGSFALIASKPVPFENATPLASFLRSHQLTRGVGDYWSSSIVTVESSNAVVVRPVIVKAAGLERYMKQTSSTWYRASFQFLVYNSASPWGGVGSGSATATFGKPVQVIRIGTYRVLLWGHPIYVSTTPPGSA
ncbi:MAG: hypothetical protein ACRDZP_04500 [Acidimicrobiales bacterium]